MPAVSLRTCRYALYLHVRQPRLLRGWMSYYSFQHLIGHPPVWAFYGFHRPLALFALAVTLPYAKGVDCSRYFRARSYAKQELPQVLPFNRGAHRVIVVAARISLAQLVVRVPFAYMLQAQHAHKDVAHSVQVPYVLIEKHRLMVSLSPKAYGIAHYRSALVCIKPEQLPARLNVLAVENVPRHAVKLALIDHHASAGIIRTTLPVSCWRELSARFRLAAFPFTHIALAVFSVTSLFHDSIF